MSPLPLLLVIVFLLTTPSIRSVEAQNTYERVCILFPVDPVASASLYYTEQQGGLQDAKDINDDIVIFENITGIPPDVRVVTYAIEVQQCTHIMFSSGDFTNYLPDILAPYNDRDDLLFSLVDGCPVPQLPNLQCLVFRDDQPGFIAGTLLGLATKTKIVGQLWGFPASSAVFRWENGIRSGVRFVCPECTILTAYLFLWWSNEGNPIVQHMIDNEGVDAVLTGCGGCDPEAASVTTAANVTVVGTDTDWRNNAWYTALNNSLEVYVGSGRKIVRALTREAALGGAEGTTFRGDFWFFDTTNGAAGLGPCATEGCWRLGDDGEERAQQIVDDLSTGQISTRVDFLSGFLAFDAEVDATPNSWQTYRPTGFKPAPREHFAVAKFTDWEEWLFMFGGHLDTGRSNELWVYETGMHDWMRRSIVYRLDETGYQNPPYEAVTSSVMPFHPVGQAPPTDPFLREMVVMFGGVYSDGTTDVYTNDILVYDPHRDFGKDDKLIRVQLDGVKPTARSDASAVSLYWDRQVIVFGGRTFVRLLQTSGCCLLARPQ